MKNIYKDLLLLIVFTTISINAGAQCAALVNNGSSSNLFTLIRNSTNPIAVDKNLNTVVYIHRNNANIFGGNSGQLRYDVSYNGGTTFTNNIGVLNPVGTSPARYPNVAIHNPTNNTNPANAYLGYIAPTINPTTALWNGVVTGVAAMSTPSNTENYNQPVNAPQLIAHSMVRGAPGVFWAVDALYNGTSITGLAIYKGVWNTSSNDIVWSTNFTVSPSFNTGLNTAGIMGDYNIAFDPSGTNGWMSFLSHLTPGPSNYAYYPVFYRTTNGGQTWTGPIQVNLNTLGCLTAGLTSTTNVVTTNFEHDLAVDMNGNPHLLTTICNGSNAYGVFYTQWHHMYDITLKNGLWVAYDVANVLAGRAIWGTSPNTIIQDMAPQVARSSDGTKIFFTWTDNANYTLGQANMLPDLLGKGYNVSNDTWTQTKNFTSCNSVTSGSIIVPHIAADVLEPSSTVWKIAPVYGVFTSNNDPVLACNFNFLDNVTFSVSEFSVAAPASPTISIAQGTNVLLCPGSTINISLAGNAGQAIWSTGGTGTSIAISNPTITTYSVIAQQNCLTGTTSIGITNMSVSATGPQLPLCLGDTATFTAGGNAISYTWMPGNISGTSAAVVASSTQVYTLTGSSNANCTSNATVGITVVPLPTVTIAGNNTVCIGSVLTVTAGGTASNFTWSPGGSNSAVLQINTQVDTSLVVLGEDANGCQNVATINVTVMPVPTVAAVSDKTATCPGDAVSLSASGASTYSWSTGATAPSIVENPSVSTTYTVTGTASNTCQDTETVSILVHPFPNVVISSASPTMCVGEKVKLSVSGALSYFWSNASTSATIQVQPTSTTIYTVIGTGVGGCKTTASFTQAVSECVGLEEHSGKNVLVVYPNPSQSWVAISAEKDLSLELVNELGQLIRQISLSAGTEIKLYDLSPGVYFLKEKSNHYPAKKIIIHD